MTILTISSGSASHIAVDVSASPKTEITIDRGLLGPPGPSAVGGFPFAITGLQTGDVLQFGGEQWVNTPQTELTDGGNF
ncbi:MAG: hypothetical protein WBI20_14790 [Burkholderiaceae bacterium]